MLRLLKMMGGMLFEYISCDRADDHLQARRLIGRGERIPTSGVHSSGTCHDRAAVAVHFTSTSSLRFVEWRCRSVLTLEEQVTPDLATRLKEIRTRFELNTLQIHFCECAAVMSLIQMNRIK
jgi:hypothetical protein